MERRKLKTHRHIVVITKKRKKHKKQQKFKNFGKRLQEEKKSRFRATLCELKIDTSSVKLNLQNA